MHAGSPECMQAALNACMNSEKWLAASQPFCGPRMADMARTVKMHRLPGARMAPPGARAQGAVAMDILWPVRARARVSRSKFRKIRAPQCQSAVKMGGRTVPSQRSSAIDRSSDLPPGGQSVIDLKSTYCFCAHMHEIMKYFLFTENQ